MRLPLLIGANPKFVKNGSRIPLGKGDWNIQSDHSNSKVTLRHGDSSSHLQAPVNLTGPIDVQVFIEENGNENSINVYAEKVA